MDYERKPLSPGVLLSAHVKGEHHPFNTTYVNFTASCTRVHALSDSALVSLLAFRCRGKFINPGSISPGYLTTAPGADGKDSFLALRPAPASKPLAVICVMPGVLVAENLNTGVWQPNFPYKADSPPAKAIAVDFPTVYSDRLQSLVHTVFMPTQPLTAEAYLTSPLIRTRLRQKTGTLTGQSKLTSFYTLKRKVEHRSASSTVPATMDEALTLAYTDEGSHRTRFAAQVAKKTRTVPVFDATTTRIDFPNNLPPMHCPRWYDDVPPRSVVLVAFTVNTRNETPNARAQEEGDAERPAVFLNLNWVVVLDVPVEHDTTHRKDSVESDESTDEDGPLAANTSL